MLPHNSTKLVAISILFLCLNVQSYPADRMTLVGQGKMKWGFWDLYTISLYTSDGNYLQGEYPQALEIKYLRPIKKKHLITATIKQWRHLNVDWREEWVTELEGMWPSVERDDVLAFHIGSDGVGRFYLNREFIGELNDQEFSENFIAIWLSPNTSAEKVRNEIIGVNDA